MKQDKHFAIFCAVVSAVIATIATARIYRLITGLALHTATNNAVDVSTGNMIIIASLVGATLFFGLGAVIMALPDNPAGQ